MANVRKNIIPEVSIPRKNKQIAYSGRINGKRSLDSSLPLSCGPILYHELPRADYFQIYDSIYKNTPEYTIQITDLPDTIRTWRIKTNQGKEIDIQKRYNRLKSSTHLSEKEIKLLCPAITVNGCFFPIKNKDNISALTGFLFIDYDDDLEDNDLEDITKQKSLAREKIGKYCLSIHKSFRGGGLHVIVRVNLKTPDEIPVYQEAISKILGLTHDKICSDVTRFMVISHDPETITNRTQEVFTLPPQACSKLVTGIKDPSVIVPVSPLNIDGKKIVTHDRIIEFITENDLWGKARMQDNAIFEVFSLLVDKFPPPELVTFMKTDELRLKLFHPDSDTGRDLEKVLDQLRRIYNREKQGPFGIVFRDVFFSDYLTWKGSYVYAGLRMYVNKSHECRVSQITLAKKLSISRDTVMRGINELIELKYVIRKKGKGRNNLYCMICDLPFMDNYRPYGKVFHDILFADNLTWKGKAIYIGLMVYIGAKGEWRVPNSTLAKDLKVSIDTVMRGINEVITAGIFTRECKKGGNHFYRFIYVAHSGRVPLTATPTKHIGIKTANKDRTYI
ncbi:MAG: hypothetical protein GH151_09385 [Bacteroidetes bacterium]|nr:hypothetical protein [Bacteroidota bacterium]